MKTKKYDTLAPPSAKSASGRELAAGFPQTAQRWTERLDLSATRMKRWLRTAPCLEGAATRVTGSKAAKKFQRGELSFEGVFVLPFIVMRREEGPNPRAKFPLQSDGYENLESAGIFRGGLGQVSPIPTNIFLHTADDQAKPHTMLPVVLSGRARTLSPFATQESGQQRTISAGLQVTWRDGPLPLNCLIPR